LVEEGAEVFERRKCVDRVGRLSGFWPLGAAEKVEVLVLSVVSLL
jgi:hypothetical protein